MDKYNMLEKSSRLILFVFRRGLAYEPTTVLQMPLQV